MEGLKMNFDFSKKSTIAILLLLNLILGLPLLLGAVEERQEIRKKAAEANVVKFSLSPSTKAVNQGENFLVTVQLKNTDTETKPVRVAGVALNFDSQYLAVSELKCGSDFPAKALPESGSPPSPPGWGIEDNHIYLTCFRYQNGEPMAPFDLVPQTAVDLGSFLVTAKNGAPTGEATISFARTNVPNTDTLVNLANTGQTGRYQVGMTGPIVSGVAKIKLAGISQEKADQAFAIKIAQTSQLLKELDNINGTADPLGVYETERFSLSPEVGQGTNYNFFVKGPKHLQTKFANTTVEEGENVFDFTSSPLLAGDLPHPLYGQDGTVGALDAVLLTNCFTTPEKEECLSWADLNLDGIINSLDMNLMNLTILSERWDDETI
jgi:hypothetical protein